MRKGTTRARISLSWRIAIFLLLIPYARGDNGWERQTVSLIWDNDATYGTLGIKTYLGS